MAQPRIVSTAAQSVSSNPSSFNSTPIPLGVEVGDLLLGVYTGTTQSSSLLPSAPSGWTTHISQYHTASGNFLGVWSRRAVQADVDASYRTNGSTLNGQTVLNTGPTYRMTVMNVRNAGVIESAVPRLGQAGDPFNRFYAPAITPTVADSTLLSFFSEAEVRGAYASAPECYGNQLGFTGTWFSWGTQKPLGAAGVAPAVPTLITQHPSSADVLRRISASLLIQPDAAAKAPRILGTKGLFYSEDLLRPASRTFPQNTNAGSIDASVHPQWYLPGDVLLATAHAAAQNINFIGGNGYALLRTVNLGIDPQNQYTNQMAVWAKVITLPETPNDNSYPNYNANHFSPFNDTGAFTHWATSVMVVADVSEVGAHAITAHNNPAGSVTPPTVTPAKRARVLQMYLTVPRSEATDFRHPVATFPAGASKKGAWFAWAASAWAQLDAITSAGATSSNGAITPVATTSQPTGTFAVAMHAPNSPPATPGTITFTTSASVSNQATASAVYSDPEGTSGRIDYEYSTASNFATFSTATGSSVASGQPSVATLTLAPNTLYYVRARSFDGIDVSAYSTTQTHTIARTPNVPTALAPTGTRPSAQVTLSATVSDLDGGDVSAQFQVALDAGFTSGVQTFTGASVTSGGSSSVATGSNLAPGTMYYLRARAVDPQNNMSAYSSAVTFTTAARVTSTFVYTGADQSFSVPSSVSAVSIDLFGAQGGSLAEAAGGLGGRVEGSLTTTPGETLTIRVGQAGAAGRTTTSFGGGGAGGATGAAGGGGTYIFRSSTLLAAGSGGGGASATYPGGAGGGAVGSDALGASTLVMTAPAVAAVTPNNFRADTSTFNQRRIDRCQDGTLWTGYSANNSPQFALRYSKDGGATWQGAVIAPTDLLATRTSLFIDVDDYAHLVWRQESQNGSLSAGHIYYSRGTPNAGRTAWTWSTAQSIAPNSGVTYDYPDVVAHREGTGWVAHVVHWFYEAASADTRTFYRRFVISSAGAIADQGNTIISSNYATAVSTYPSIDFNHTGDGKTVAGGTPHLYVGWTAGATGAGKGVRFRKAVYTAGAWTWNAEREIDPNRYVSGPTPWLVTLFDGTRVVLTGQITDQTGSVNTDLMMYERDASDATATVTRVLLDNVGTGDVAAQLSFGSAAFDNAGNVYIFGRDGTGGNGTRKINRRKWTRSTATLDPIETIDATGNDAPYLSARRGAGGNAVDVVWTDGTSSPYTVQFARSTFTTDPASANRATGGTQSAGGQHGGASQLGAAARSSVSGGGGGGFFGGGTVNTEGAGAGGSSLTPSGGTTTPAARSGDGAATLSYANYSLAANNAPTVTLLLPAAGATELFSYGYTFTWSYSDPDGNAQGSYLFERTNSAGLVEWWNGTDWQTSATFVPSASSSVTFPAGAWPAGQYSYRVQVTDALGAQSAYTAARSITSRTSGLAMLV